MLKTSDCKPPSLSILTSWARRSAKLALVAALAIGAGSNLVACAGQAASTTEEVAQTNENAQNYKLVKAGTLTVSSDLANPPFDSLDGTEPVGFEVDLVNALAEKMGLSVSYLPAMKFDSIVPTIQQGDKADIGASNFTITDERKEEVDFTDPYIDSNQGIVTTASLKDSVTKDYSVLNTPTTTVAVQAGTTGEAWAKENVPNATIVSLDDPIAALTGVSTGLYSAAIADLPVMQYEVNTSFTSLAVALEIPTGEQYGLVVSKDNPELTKALNAALAEIKSDGTLDELKTKWFGTSSVSTARDTSSTSTSSQSLSASANSSAEAITVSKATARPNEDGGDGVIGGMQTRLTWEATVNAEAGLKNVTLELPEGASFEGSSTRITVLDGLNRKNITGTATPHGSSIEVSFDEAISAGSLLRLEITDMSFPEAGGSYSVTGSYTLGDGTEGALAESPSIAIIANTPVQKIVNWLDGQAWVDAWNSVPFLNMFFKPQLLVTSFVSLSGGWLVCLAIVVVAYPFAIALGLSFAIMKISRIKILRGIASLYINILRGTPLFLQIYIMFFGLPMMGINIDNNVLGVIVMAVNSSAYLAEIFRAGIQSIPLGQYEAASSLGMNRAQTMFYIILPQTVRRVIPTVTSDFITSYKDTSLLSSVGVMELMMFSKNLTTVSGNITPYMAAAIYYLIVTLPLIKIVGIIERKLASDERGGGPRPTAKAGASEEAQAEGPSASSAYHAEGIAGSKSALSALLAPFVSHTKTTNQEA